MKRFLWLGAIVALVVLLWSGAWLFAAGMIRGEIETLAENDGITEARLTCDEIGVAGYPFRFDVTCSQAELLSGDVLVGIDELRATVRVYRPTHALIYAHSPAAITDAFTGASRELRWTDMEASVRLEGWRLARASMVAENLSLFDTLVSETLIASATGFQMHLLDIPERYDELADTQSLALYQQLSGLSMPSANIEDGMWETEAELNALPADVRYWGERDLLQRWQTGGGTVNLVSLNAQDAQRLLQADGQFSLTDSGQLNGMLNLTTNGLVEEFGDLVPGPYYAILFSEPAEDGSFSNSIRFTNGIATAGLLPLGVIGPLF